MALTSSAARAIAHDLRTPLFSLRTYLEGLERGLADTPDKAARYIAVCREKANVLERLVADLFAFIRMEYLETTLQRETMTMDNLLRRIVDEWAPRMEQKGITLTLEVENASSPIIADPHLLTRAIENLLDNALRHTSPGGAVHVQCCEQDGHVLFSIDDTGPGLSPQDLLHAFDPLYRGETSRNRETGGIGLGLTITQRILQAHHGQLLATNGPHGGAKFTGSLPILTVMTT